MPRPLASLLVLALLALSGCLPRLTVRGGDAMTDVPPTDVRDGGDAGDVVTDGPPADGPPACPLPIVRAINLGETVSGTLMGTISANPATSCSTAVGFAAAGPDQFYTLAVATRTGVTFGVERTDIPDGGTVPDAFPVVAVRRACDNGATEVACAAWIPPASLNGRTSVVLDPGFYFVVVDQVSSSATPAMGPMPYRLTATPYAPAANATCDARSAIADGTLNDQRPSTGSSSANICSGGALGPRLWYRATIAPQSFLSITATPTTASDADQVTVQVFDSCAAMACRNEATSGGTAAARTPATTVAANAADTPVEVVIAVAAMPGSSNDMAYSLTLETTQSPYTRTVTTAMCDDMTGATAAVPSSGGAWIDDSVTAVMPLPIPVAFTFFGDAVTHYSIASNGFIQLYPSATATPSMEYRNVSLPNPVAAPLGMIGAFWDDVAEGGDGSQTIRTQLFTTGTPHFTVEWRNWGLYMETNTRLIFQLKAFGDGSVEFHYCEMALLGAGTPMRITGSSATIGMQNLAGTRAALHSFDQLNAIMTGLAVRFVPR